MGFPGGASGKEPSCRCRRHKFNLWVKKISWRREWQSPLEYSCLENPTDRGILAGYGLRGDKELVTTETTWRSKVERHIVVKSALFEHMWCWYVPSHSCDIIFQFQLLVWCLLVPLWHLSAQGSSSTPLPAGTNARRVSPNNQQERNTAPPISKSKLTKVILSSQTCQNTTPDVALSTEGRDSALPTKVQAPVPPTRKPVTNP